MRRFIVGLLAVIGALTLLGIIAVAAVVSKVVAGRTTLPGTIVLTADLTQGLDEGSGESTFERLVAGSKPTLRDVVDAIERGERDPRVKGLVARVGDDSLGLGKVQQVRDAIAEFRRHGKFAIAFADSFGELGPGTRPYYLATAFDEIWLQPMGTLGLTGLYVEEPFFKGTLDLLGVAAAFSHREQYKTAINPLTKTAMTPPEREETDALLASDAGQIVQGIAEGRRLAPATVRADIDNGPYFSDAALKAKLVDRLGYDDQALAQARQRAGRGAKLVSLADYIAAAGRPNRSGATVALIYGTGLIQRGGDSQSLLGSQTGMSASRVARAFRDAARDKQVRAILFRIDSPGGSVVASETIWRAVAEARKHGKPVIVSMGDVAGSGGYYVAADADKIVAEPATLTGSIGVLAGKFVVAGLLKKLGITTDSAQFGADAGMFSAASDFSPEAHQRLEHFLDAIYEGFKTRVASGRHMTRDQVEAVAKGRVWTGAEAKQRGLVDALGGYATALRLARAAAKIPAGAPVKIIVFPRPKGTGEILYHRLFGGGRDESARLGMVGEALTRIGPMLARLEALSSAPALLLMPLSGTTR